MKHNYIAEPREYPTVMKTMGYSEEKAFRSRYKKTDKEKAELYALKFSYEQALKKEHGANWKQALRTMYRPSRPFTKSIVSGTKVLFQWN